MKSARAILVALILLTLAGCGGQQPPAKGLGIRNLELRLSGLMPGVDVVFVPCLSRNDKPALVILSDAPKGEWVGNYKKANQVPTGKGVLIYPGADGQPNREIPIEGESEEGGMGQCTIAGKTYDLAKGALFLVSGIDDGLRVKQLSREMNRLSFDPSELATFGKNDAEITAFFSKAK